MFSVLGHAHPVAYCKWLINKSVIFGLGALVVLDSGERGEAFMQRSGVFGSWLVQPAKTPSMYLTMTLFVLDLGSAHMKRLGATNLEHKEHTQRFCIPRLLIFFIRKVF